MIKQIMHDKALGINRFGMCPLGLQTMAVMVVDL